jgi:GDP-4-dehydro-6-deoxy-D-mannose reductase
MTVLITGGDGFIASHLIDHILDNTNKRVYATVRRGANLRNIQHRLGEKRLSLIEMELTDYHSVLNAVKEACPRKVFHLAAQSFVPESWKSPSSTFDVNAKGTLNVLEAARNWNRDTYVQIAGSSEEYGLVYPEECPIREISQPLRPLSPYGVSKVAADYLGYQYAQSYKMNVLRTRTFNQTGPRRGESFVDSNFAKQIALVENGKQEPIIYHGNLDAVREFTDVRDTVKAYWMLSELQWQGDVMNICSGRGYEIREVATMLAMNSSVNVQMIPHPDRQRPSDVPLLVGCNDLLRSYIKWEPTIDYHQSLRDLLNYWRCIV